MPDRCAAIGCPSTKINSPLLSFFRFPKDIERCKIWCIYAGREQLSPTYMNNNLRLCSMHFTDVQFSNDARSRLSFCAMPDVENTRPSAEVVAAARSKAEKNAQPSIPCTVEASSSSRPIFPGMQPLALNSDKSKTQYSTPVKCVRDRSPLREENMSCITSPSGMTNLLANESRLEKMEEKVQRLESVVSELDTLNYNLQLKLASQNGVPQTLRPTVNFMSVKKLGKNQSDSQCCHHTGFTHHTFTKLFHLLVPASYTTESLPHAEILNLEDQLFLTLMHLWNGDSVEDLSVQFEIPTGSVQALVDFWLDHMYVRFQSMSLWSHRDTIMINMPTEYIEDFPTALAMIECFEILVKQPTSSENLQSNYFLVLKGLLATDPKGALMYASSLSSKAVTPSQFYQESGLESFLRSLKDERKIQDGDSIILPDGFDIRDELAEIGLRMVTVPVPTTLQNLTAQQQAHAKKVALHRINVKRLIRRIKNFHILSGVIPHELGDVVNMLWIVCAHLANLQLQE